MNKKILFIFGCGPSLANIDITKIPINSFIFGCNTNSKIKNINYTHYFVNDINYTKNYSNAKYCSNVYLSKKTIRITGNEIHKKLPVFDGHTEILKIKNRKNSSDDLSYYVNGYSIINLMLQYSLNFEIDEIIISGVDFNYVKIGPKNKLDYPLVHPRLDLQINTFLEILEKVKKRKTKIFINSKKSLLASKLNFTEEFNK